MKWLAPVHRCHLEWGPRGAVDAASRGDVVIVVDVLSFTSAVATAIEAGGEIVPARDQLEGRHVAVQLGAELAGKRGEAGATFSLSPLSFRTAPEGRQVVLASPNGATCALAAAGARALLAGCLLNASAVAACAERLATREQLGVTVVPAGERWPETGELRVAIEDYLGAGAILSGVGLEKSPEAAVCVAAFEVCRDRIFELIWQSSSGRELQGKGYGADVRHSAQLDLFESVPLAKLIDKGRPVFSR